jgi:hypothetical protein
MGGMTDTRRSGYGSRTRYWVNDVVDNVNKAALAAGSPPPLNGLSPGMNREQTLASLKQRKTNSIMESAHGAIGLGGVGVLGASHIPGLKQGTKQALEHASLATAVGGAGVGGLYALRRARTDRKNIAAQQQQLGVVKSAPLQTTMTPDQAHAHLKQYGLTGPLPAGLDRNAKMKAYEARYVAAGGPKGEAWHRRKQRAGVVRAGLGGVAAAGALGVLGSRSTKVSDMARRAVHNVPKLKKVEREALQRRAENVGLTAGVGSYGADAYAQHAQHKQSSYASAPAGVAASALRRMRAYDQGGTS